MHGPRKTAQKTALTALIVAAGAAAPAALAATSPVTMTVTPKTPKQGATVSISATNVPAQGTTLPSSITVSLPGFTTSSAKGRANSVAAFCTAAQATAKTCPITSQVGTGSATIVATLQPTFQAFNPGPITATLAGYLEAPTQHGAVADVDLVFSTAKYGTQSITGYLVPTATGLTLTIPDLSALSSQFSAYSAYITSINLQSLSLKLGAHHTVSTTTTKKVKEKVHGRTTYVNKKVATKTTHYLLVTPKTCTSKGWGGTLAIAYATGPVTYSATAACSK